MIVLDTNVVSELMREGSAPQVREWFFAQSASDVYLSAITEAELRCGIAIMPAGRRRSTLATALEGFVEGDLEGRVLSFDTSAARASATIGAKRRAAGRPIGHAVCQIAAIARSQGAAVATRDRGGFEGTGVDIIDPWAD